MKFIYTTALLILSQLYSFSQINTIPAIAFFQGIADTKNEYILDVRSPQEFASEHLNNAINIDVNASDFSEKIDKLDKSRTVFVYCLSGGRSVNAASVLQQHGFSKIYNLEGGILQWKANKFPLNTTNLNTPIWIGMTKEEFNTITNDPIPVLIDFKAAWCGPCKMLKPILDDIAQEYKGKIKIVEIDVDKNRSLADAMYVKSIPLLVYYINGKTVMNIEGYMDKKALVKSLKLK